MEYIGFAIDVKELTHEVYVDWKTWCNNSQGQYMIALRDNNGVDELFTLSTLEKEAFKKQKCEKIEEYLGSLNLNLSEKKDFRYNEYAHKFMKSASLFTKKLIPYEKYLEPSRKEN